VSGETGGGASSGGGRPAESEGPPLRVLIADDHALVRRGLAALLGGAPGITVVGEAATGAEAVARAAALRPDVILMDLQMPGGSGVEATRAIRAADPQARVLVVTLFEDDDSVFLALRAGARGYVLKDADEAELLRAVRAVGRGEAIFGPAVASRVLAFFAAPPGGGAGGPAPAFPELTEREREVLDLMAAGHPNPAIARRLGLSPKTVGNYVSAVFGKLQVADRAEAIIRARDAGLGRG
jgi:DNA-binding NarL/FixJ family response regulator